MFRDIFKRLVLFFFLLAAALMLLSPSTHAARSDDSREELRRLLSLPQMHWTFGAGFNSGFGRLVLKGVPPDLSELPELRAKHKNKPGDGEICLKLADLLDTAGESSEAGRLASNAVSLLRLQSEQRPTDAHLLACLGEALYFINSPECESVFRRAVALAPNSAEAWLALGHYLNATLFRKLMGEKKSSAQDMMTFLQLIMLTLRPTPAQFEAAEQAHSEAMKAFHTAASLDTNNPAIFEHRAGCIVSGELIAVIKKFDPASKPDPSRPPPVLRAIFNPAALPDLRHAAALAPDDPILLTAATYYETFTLSLEQTGGKMNEATYDRMVAVLSTEAPEHLRRQLDHLNRLADSPVKTKAAMANEFLGCMQLMPLRQNSKAEASFRRALALAPDRELSWDGLIATLVTLERYDDYLVVAQDRLKRSKTARNHLIVAKSYAYLKRRDQELEHARAALALEPKDLEYHTAVAVAIAHQKDTPEAVDQAGNTLAKAADFFRQASGEHQLHYHLTRAILLALAGEPLAARGALRRVLEADPNNEDAKAALAIIQKW